MRESKADLGVIFDTDVDRGGAVDSKGNEINRNRLVAVAAAIALEGNDGGTIVTDSITSSGLKEFIEKNLGPGKSFFAARSEAEVRRWMTLNLAVAQLKATDCDKERLEKIVKSLRRRLPVRRVSRPRRLTVQPPCQRFWSSYVRG